MKEVCWIYSVNLQSQSLNSHILKKTVYLIRHAKSSWKDLSLEDINRPLNKRGRRDAPIMATRLSKMQIKPDAIISSPAKRAYATATIFAEVLGVHTVIEDASIYEAFPSTIFHLIQNLSATLNTVLIFGHNPTITSIANSFGSTYIDNVPTCGILHIEATIDDWANFNKENGILKAFYYPKQQG